MPLVVSPYVILPDGADATPNNPLIGYDNLANVSNIATTTQQTDYPRTNMANPATHLVWRSNDDNATEYVTVTLSGSDPVDYFGIARHNFATGAIAVACEVSTDGTNFTEVGALSGLVDNDPIMFWFAKDEYAKVRLKLTVGATLAQIATIFVGELLVVQRRVYVGHTPITMGRVSKVTNARSEQGHFLGRIVTGEYRQTKLALQNLTAAWVRSDLMPFLKYAQEAPFFFAWRPTSYPLEVGYCWLMNDPQPVNQRTNGMMQVNLDLSGVA